MPPSLSNLAVALIAATKELKNPERNKSNSFYDRSGKPTYADLAAYINEAKDILAKHDLVILQTNAQSEIGVVNIVTTLLHSSGEFVTSTLSMPVAKPTDPQAVGSAITYGRRYAYAAMIGLAPEDDDGNKAAGLEQLKKVDVKPKEALEKVNKAVAVEPKPEIGFNGDIAKQILTNLDLVDTKEHLVNVTKLITVNQTKLTDDQLAEVRTKYQETVKRINSIQETK